ncbi:glycosyl hydrolase family 18 protein [Streptomyces sp. Ag109_O5-10]|uniref:glycosyl hydrolase family 18 protein n=1 Tax=Streptomyces sp. Ag109_O5-10 TaxID=1855349 RepID=UPI000899F16C|nr:glycosyl hydrolase family 18 protein [Streptomyces sp. Ag109_O5-10]SEE63658.1 Glycosyl hydrolases family 18 [Streptomyces sp. Ag109_O5-10]
MERSPNQDKNPEPAPTEARTGAPAPAPVSAAPADGPAPAPPSAAPAAADVPETPQGPAAPDDQSRTGRAGGKKRAVRWTLGVLALLVLPLLIAETALRIDYAGDPKAGTYSRNRDALWLGHAWVDGRRTDADVTALAARLADTGIRDLYVHAGPLEHNGTLPTSAYPKARWLITAVHRKLPGVRVQAWLGDEVAPEKPDAMHLEKKATRDAVVESARQIVGAGFDGVHFDLEPLHSGDRNYLALLDALRPVTPLLSVAAHQIDPLPAFHSFWGTVTGHPKWWSQEYFGQVARRVDQIAVMSYDTMQPLQSLYGGYVAQQTSLALEVTPADTDLLMGLPFYHENRFGHRAHAETVPAAVRGVRLGLSRTAPDRATFGVALYVDFAATEDDWTSYRKDWVRTS